MKKKDWSAVPLARRQAWQAYKKELKVAQEAKLSQGYVLARDLDLASIARGVDFDSTDNANQLDNGDEPDPLFVYEPDDLNDFQIEDVRAVWERRIELCGTLEAAAEVFAILRVASGADISYLGWRKYLSHEMITALEEVLPRLEFDEKPLSDRGGRDLADMLTDRRQVALRNVRLRSGQASFREEVIAFHHGRCCFTGCNEPLLLEAAHIIPYKGEHSHDVQNGLSIRVDIHRLFDAHLLSIEPDSFEIAVSRALSDRFYLSLEGRRLFRSDNAPNRLYLRHHFDLFNARLARAEENPGGKPGSESEVTPRFHAGTPS